jgi:hypothetical protein
MNALLSAIWVCMCVNVNESSCECVCVQACSCRHTHSHIITSNMLHWFPYGMTEEPSERHRHNKVI